MSAPATINFEQAKAALLRSDNTGRSIFDHLADVVLRLVEEQPADAVDRFEQISLQVKEESFTSGGVQRRPKVSVSMSYLANPHLFQPTEFETAEEKLRTDVTQLFKVGFPCNQSFMC
jgi:hypothetical protein